MNALEGHAFRALQLAGHLIGKVVVVPTDAGGAIKFDDFAVFVFESFDTAILFQHMYSALFSF
nr:hypothetical protein [Pseudovibrio ascidiaceicola]